MDNFSYALLHKYDDFRPQWNIVSVSKELDGTVTTIREAKAPLRGCKFRERIVENERGSTGICRLVR